MILVKKIGALFIIKDFGNVYKYLSEAVTFIILNL